MKTLKTAKYYSQISIGKTVQNFADLEICKLTT
jgi:hypothetical protein